MAIYPSAGSDRWAVAQAGPFRRMDIHGGLELAPSQLRLRLRRLHRRHPVSGRSQPFSQQQWFTRNSNFGSGTGSVWNMVFSGVIGAPAQSFPNPPYTTLGPRRSVPG